MTKQVFFDPQRKRWKRLRRIFDIVAVLGVIIGVFFVIGLMRMRPLPDLALSAPKKNLSPLQLEPAKPGQRTRATHRKTTLKPSDVILNSGERLVFDLDLDEHRATMARHVRDGDVTTVQTREFDFQATFLKLTGQTFE